MNVCLPNHNPNLQILTASVGYDGEVEFSQEPLVGYVVEDGAVAGLIGLEAPSTNEEQAVIDAASGAWWVLGDACGETIEGCRSHLKDYCGAPEARQAIAA